VRRGSPALYRFDEGKRRWERVESVYDANDNRIVARVEHFSVYAAGSDSGQASFGAEYLPSSHGFSTNEWLGDSRVDYAAFGAALWAQTDGSELESFGFRQVREERWALSGGSRYSKNVRFYYQCNGGQEEAACGSGNEGRDLRRGKAYYSAVLDNGDHEIIHIHNVWSAQTVSGTALHWVRRDSRSKVMANGGTQKTVYLYEENHQGNAQYGNVTGVETYADDGNTLVRKTERYYYPNEDTDHYIVDRPGIEEVEEGQSVCREKSLLYYDGAESVSTPPTKGELTTVKAPAVGCNSQWIVTTYDYDVYGNRTKVTDPDGHVTETAYDATGHVYPIRVTRPATGNVQHVTHYTWDKIVGQVEEVVDENGVATEYRYDGLGRLTKMWKYGDSESQPTVDYQYSNYGGSNAPFHVRMRWLTENGGRLYRQDYYDGWGRQVQVRQEDVQWSAPRVVSYAYNPLGKVMTVTVPYAGTAGVGTYQAPSWDSVA